MVKVKKEDVDVMRAEWNQPIKCADADADADADVEVAPGTPSLKSRSADLPPEQAVPITPESPIHQDAHIIKNTEQGIIPSKKWTGVDESITEICANLSNQIYDAESKDYFKFNADVNAEVIIFDSHGDLNPAIPSFAVVATQDTLIMGWRGTSEVMDMVTDAAMAPVVSTELGEAATGIRAHGMICSLVGSDLKVHENAIISYIKKHRITDIVFTGHSLGGAMASTAHLFLQAQVGGYNDASAWNGLRRLTLRSVTFAAPMSVLDRDEVEVDNAHSDKLIQEVGKNTCNFIFASDMVPRAYAHTQYLYQATEAATPEAIKGNNPLWFGLGSGRISESVLNFLRETLTPLIPIATKFRHTGSLLYYEDEKATEPLVLTDTGPAGKVPSQDKTHLNYYTYGSYKIRRGDHIDTILKTHSHFPKTLASYISVEKEDSK